MREQAALHSQCNDVESGADIMLTMLSVSRTACEEEKDPMHHTTRRLLEMVSSKKKRKENAHRGYSRVGSIRSR